MSINAKLAPLIDWYSSLKLLYKNKLINSKEVFIICSLLILTTICEAAAITCFIPLLEYLQQGSQNFELTNKSIWWKLFSSFFSFFGATINLLNLSLLIIFLTFTRQIFNFFSILSITKMKYQIGKSLSEKCFTTIFNSNALNIQKFNTGSFINTLDHLPQASGVVARALATLFSIGITIFVYSSIMLITAPYASLFVFIILITILFCVEKWVKIGLKISRDFIDFRQKYTSFLSDRIKNWRAIKTSVSEKKEINFAKIYMKEFYDYGIKIAKNSNKYLLIVSPIMTTITLGILFVSINFFNVKITEIAVFILILVRFIPVAQSMASQRQMIAAYHPSLIHCLDVIRSSNIKRENMKKGKEFKNNFKNIIFKNITFSYNNSNVAAVKNISCSFPSKQKTAIIGRSGAGKSTMTDLISTLIRPMNGQIFIDNKNYNYYSLESIRRRIAYVSQQPLIFSATIKDNIVYASNRKHTKKEIIKASKDANAHDFINALPNGYDTFLNEGGANLSGGEKQRLMLARAFLMKSDIIILDEATSSVDIESEELINKAITKRLRSKNITCIVIAHRLSTIKNSDHIIVLNKGQIEVIGNPKNLKYNENWYKKMLDTG